MILRQAGCQNALASLGTGPRPLGYCRRLLRAGPARHEGLQSGLPRRWHNFLLMPPRSSGIRAALTSPGAPACLVSSRVLLTWAPDVTYVPLNSGPSVPTTRLSRQHGPHRRHGPGRLGASAAVV